MSCGRFSSYEEFAKELALFHGRMAPGGILGYQMVKLAQNLLPEGCLMDVICETRKCLTDAIQLLTPCTIGNHWLKIVDTGRFAAVFYDKTTGEGVRISLSMEKLKRYPVVNEWFLKLTEKEDQNLRAILDQINEAGADLFDYWPVEMNPELIKVKVKRPPVICPCCGEAYPPSHGATCRGCQGETDKYFTRKASKE